MSGSTTTCLQCGKNNPIHRVWCEHCAAPVPCRPAPPAANAPADTERAELYRRVIEDLQTLLSSGGVSPDTYESVKVFSEDQLAQIKKQTAQRTRLQRLHQCVLSARHAAYSGRFHDAIGILQLGLADDRGEYQLQQVIKEVNEKLQQHERLLKVSREAETLLHESKAAVEALRLEEAEAKLVQANQLVSNDTRIVAALSQVRSQIADQQARELAEQQARGQAEQQARGQTAQQALSFAEPMIPEDGREAILVTTSEAQPAPGGVEPRFAKASFAAEQEEVPSPKHRVIEEASHWSSIVKPFLLDNFGWFVGAFLVVAGFIVLIVTFWGKIEQNPILIHSLVYVSLAVATGMFFAAAYFMRLKYPQLENSSNVLLVIVALLIPLLFVAALLTSFIPAEPLAVALLQIPG